MIESMLVEKKVRKLNLYDYEEIGRVDFFLIFLVYKKKDLHFHFKHRGFVMCVLLQ